VDRLVHQDPRRRGTRLALVVEHPLDDDVHGEIEIGVGEHHDGVLAAKLHRGEGQVLGGAAEDTPPSRRRARERDPLDARMRRQRRPRAHARDGVEHARRQNLVGDLDETQDRERRLLPGLDDHRVAGGKRRRGLLCEVDRRPVERQNRGDDAVRLIDDPGLDRALIEDLAVERVGQARVVVKAGVAEGEVETQGVAAWLSDLPRLQIGQLVEVLTDPGGYQPQHPAALAGRERTPLAERPARIGDRVGDELLVAVDDPPDLPAGGGLEDRERLPISDVDPPASDVCAPHGSPAGPVRRRAATRCRHGCVLGHGASLSRPR